MAHIIYIIIYIIYYIKSMKVSVTFNGVAFNRIIINFSKSRAAPVRIFN